MKINLDFIYPVGSIYETTSTIHPNILFGGTWELYGAGRVTVCRDESQSEFSTIGKTGGSKYMQKHTHNVTIPRQKGSPHFLQGVSATDIYVYMSNGTYTTTEAGTGDSGNLQPYIVVYRYRRIA